MACYHGTGYIDLGFKVDDPFSRSLRDEGCHLARFDVMKLGLWNTFSMESRFH